MILPNRNGGTQKCKLSRLTVLKHMQRQNLAAWALQRKSMDKVKGLEQGQRRRDPTSGFAEMIDR